MGYGRLCTTRANADPHCRPAKRPCGGSNIHVMRESLPADRRSQSPDAGLPSPAWMRALLD